MAHQNAAAGHVWRTTATAGLAVVPGLDAADAHIIIFLISTELLASAYVRSIEMKRALERRRAQAFIHRLLDFLTA